MQAPLSGHLCSARDAIPSPPIAQPLAKVGPSAARFEPHGSLHHLDPGAKIDPRYWQRPILKNDGCGIGCCPSDLG